MALGKGHQAYVLIAPETTYNVAATTGFQKAEVISVTCDPVIGMIPDTSLNNRRARRALYQGGLMYRGTIRVRANYEGKFLLHLLRCAFLGGASGTGTGYKFTAATNGGNHEFTDGTTLRSLTMQMQEGGVAATVQEVRGMVITGWTFRTTAGQSGDAMGVYEFSFLAATKQEGVTENGTATTFPAANPVLYHQCITQVDGSGDGSPVIRSVEIQYGAPMDDARYQLGNLNPLQPVPNDFVAATFKVTREFDSLAMFTKARSFAAPAAALQFVFQGGLIGGTDKYETEFKATNARLQDYSNPVDDYGIITATGTWLCYDDPTTLLSSVLCRIKNSEVALT